MTEPGTRSPEVVWREFRYAQPFCVFLHNVPDHFLCDLRSPNNTLAANTSENLTVHDFRDSQPVVDRLLHPIGHRNRANMPSFPNEVNDCPMVLPTLDVPWSVMDQLHDKGYISDPATKAKSVCLSDEGARLI